MLNLKGRSFLTLKDFTPREVRLMLETAKQLKNNKLISRANIQIIYEIEHYLTE